MLTLPTALTHREATASLQQLRQALQAQAGGEVMVDASALAQFDSSALAVLLACRRDCLAAGKTLVVQNLPEKLQSLASLYGVAQLLAPAP